MPDSLVRLAMVAAILLAPVCTGARADTRLPFTVAVFDVELDDYRDRASSPEQPGDRYNLLLATEALKRGLASGEKYLVVNPQPTNWVASSFQGLRLCNGCEAEIAKKLGADRSLLVVVTRVSMTDYVMSYQLRETRDGKLVASGSSDLRMGANYSWSRGAAWLASAKIASAP